MYTCKTSLHYRDHDAEKFNQRKEGNAADADNLNKKGERERSFSH